MPDEQLLQTLGELHLKSEETYEQLNGVTESTNQERHEKLSRQIEFIEEQLAGAREVWIDRRHVKQSESEWNEEVSALEALCATSRREFDQLPVTASRYAEKRLNMASLEEQTYLARSSHRFIKDQKATRTAN